MEGGERGRELAVDIKMLVVAGTPLAGIRRLASG